MLTGQAGAQQRIKRVRQSKRKERGCIGDDKAIGSAHPHARKASRIATRPRSRAATLGPSIGATGGLRPNAPSPPSTSRIVADRRRKNEIDMVFYMS
jgi:hypothetical protein